MWINTDLSKIKNKDIVIVANNRQVLAFKQTYNNQKKDSQLPQIFSWQSFLSKNYNNLTSDKRLIDSLEIKFLFKKILKKYQHNSAQSLTNEIVKNYSYLSDYLIKLSTLESSNNALSSFFVEVIAEYKKIKNQHNLIDIYDLPDLISANFTDKTIWIYGFKSLTSQQQKFLNKYKYQQLKQEKTDNINCFTFKNAIDEIKASAKWAKKIYDKNPDKSVAIICPQLNKMQQVIKSIFDQEFNDLMVETGSKSYNISLGVPLIKYTLIKDLINILEFSRQVCANSVQLDVFSQLVTSSYIKGSLQEKSERYLSINKALEHSSEQIPVNKIDIILEKCPILVDIIKQIKLSKNDNLSTHLVNFNQILKLFGFAEEKTLSSGEYQIFNKYLKSSINLNKISGFYGQLSFYSALNLLKELISSIVFQAQSSSSKVQILGSLEAQGLSFDYAWVVGTTADFLPAKIRHPLFINYKTAIKHQLPNSNYELIQTDTIKTLNSLKSLAATTIFSYAKTYQNNEQLPCVFIKFLDNAQVIDKEKITKNKYEYIDDFIVKKITNNVIKSGIKILNEQNSCAFKGFSNRLDIVNFDEDHIGFDKREQGNIMHDALKYIYQEILSQERLIEIDESSLNNLINSKLTYVLNKYPNSNFKQIEKIRLTKIILKLIEAEKQRDNFHILATEKTNDINLFGLKFKTRIDRIDRIENGDRIVFDYKTAPSPSAQYCGNNLLKVQLPIYALSNKCDGVGVIELLSNEVKFNGVARDESSIKKQKNTKCLEWDEQTAKWDEQIKQICFDFQNGKAEVSPQKNACEYCNLDLICRIEK